MLKSELSIYTSNLFPRSPHQPGLYENVKPNFRLQIYDRGRQLGESIKKKKQKQNNHRRGNIGKFISRSQLFTNVYLPSQECQVPNKSTKALRQLSKQRWAQSPTSYLMLSKKTKKQTNKENRFGNKWVRRGWEDTQKCRRLPLCPYGVRKAPCCSSSTNKMSCW